MIVIKNQQKPFWATLFLGLYIFVAFFSSQLHDHPISEHSHVVFSESMTSSDLLQNADYQHDWESCMSCHIVFTHHFIGIDVFKIPHLTPFEFTNPITAIIPKCSSIQISFSLLRGPPLA